MRLNNKWKKVLLGISAALPMLVLNTANANDEIDTKKIYDHCENKPQGKDQKTKLIIIFNSDAERQDKSAYIRYWKDYGGKKNVVDKTVIDTKYPPEQRDIRFLRVGYTDKSGKPPDQWVYLPEMKFVKRISQRSAHDLSWGYTDDDLRIRGYKEDKHTLDGSQTDKGVTVYRMTSVPKKSPLYSKRITWYKKEKEWDSCHPVKIDYYDKKGNLMKRHTMTWQVIKGAWLWETVSVENLSTAEFITYKVTDAEVDVGLKDKIFTERMLRRGYK